MVVSCNPGVCTLDIDHPLLGMSGAELDLIGTCDAKRQALAANRVCPLLLVLEACHALLGMPPAELSTLGFDALNDEVSVQSWCSHLLLLRSIIPCLACSSQNSLAS